MENSRFAKLPLELRLDIYEMLLYRHAAFRLGREEILRRRGKTRRRCMDLSWISQKKIRHLLALTETCKQIRSEALPAFFAINRFVIFPRIWAVSGQWTMQQSGVYSTELTICKRWLKMIGPQNAAAIKHFRIMSGDWRINRLGRPSGRWWNHARKTEDKYLHRSSLSSSATEAAITVHFYIKHDHKPNLTCPFEGIVWLAKYASAVFNMPTHDKNEARLAVDRGYQQKLDVLNRHEKHVGCWVASHLPHLRQGLENAYKNVKGALKD